VHAASGGVGPAPPWLRILIVGGASASLDASAIRVDMASPHHSSLSRPGGVSGPTPAGAARFFPPPGPATARRR